jgi:hypothetical protein
LSHFGKAFQFPFGFSPKPSGTIGVYNATTGAAINASFVTGLSEPGALAVSGNALFVANFKTQTVGKYDATTGAAINASFLTGLNSPIALAVSGNNLLVANSENGTAGEYDASKGGHDQRQLHYRADRTYSLAVGPTVLSGPLSQSIYYAKNIAAATAGANMVKVTFTSAAVFPDIRFWSTAALIRPLRST